MRGRLVLALGCVLFLCVRLQKSPRPVPPVPPMPVVWTEAVVDGLYPFSTINREDVARAERVCNVSTFCHRAQWIDGRLYVRDVRAIFFDRTYAMARVLPLLTTLRAYGRAIPDFDAVFHGTDYPIVEVPQGWRHAKRLYDDGRPPILFSPTTSSRHLDLPWPDFSFFPPRGDHPLRTRRWDVAQASVARAGALAWTARVARAVFTGNMMGEERRRLFATAANRSDLFFVNDVFVKSRPPSCHALRSPVPWKGGVLKDRCGLDFEAMSRYKYALNVGSNGYANKCKYLVLTGAVVVWVRKKSEHHEFFEGQLRAGVDYVAVSDVTDLPPVIEWLQMNDDIAARIADNGRRRMLALDTPTVLRYCAELLRAYAKRQTFRPSRVDASVEIACEDDLVRRYDRDGHLQRYLTQDNATCLRLQRPLRPPGWGGAYDGSKVPCLAAHDLRAEPKACPSKLDG